MEKWPRELRRASINSFGYGGANAHVIVESIESFQRNDMVYESCPAIEREGLRAYVLPISAASKQSLRTRVEQVSQIVQHSGPNILQRLLFTLTERRSHLRYRECLLASSPFDDSAASGEIKPFNVHGPTSTAAPDFAFVFTGQGAQYAGMSHELLRSNKIFRETIRRLDQVLGALGPSCKPEWTIEHSLAQLDTDEVNKVALSQPLCTAVQIGLVNILHSWDVSPFAVVGHSSGEIAAAYAAGIISEAQAIITAHLRGYALDHTPLEKSASGAMLAAGISAEAARSLIRENGWYGKVSIACINAPESVTLSGPLRDIIQFEDKIRGLHRFSRLLQTGGWGYHSPMMQAAGPLYERLLRENLENINDPTHSGINVDMYSSVGEPGDELRVIRKPVDMTTYWRHNLERPVQFHGALERLISERNCHLIEIGPHSALKGPIRQTRTHLNLDEGHLPYSPTLIRGQDAEMCMMSLAGNLFVHGHRLKWSKVNDLSTINLKHLHDLAPYPWDYGELLWNEPRASIELRNRSHPRHELLGSKQLAGDGIHWSWRNILRLHEMPWMRDHRLEDQVVFPAAGYLAIAIEAISQIRNPNNHTQHDVSGRLLFQFRNVAISRALFLRDDHEASQETTELHTTLSPHRLSTTTLSSSWYHFVIASWSTGHSTVHCVGEIRADLKVDFPGSAMILGADTFEKSDPQRWYEKSRENGFGFENSFRSLVSVATDGNRMKPESACLTKLTPPVANLPHATHYPIHPITIDACIQAGIIAGTSGNLNVMGAWLPISIEKARIRTLGRSDPDSDGEIHANSTKTGLSTRRADSTLRNRNAEVIVDLLGLRLSSYTQKKYTSDSAGDGQHRRHPCLRAKWSPDITRLDHASESQINDYVSNQIGPKRPSSADNIDEYLLCMGVLLDLAGHKNPRLRVLEIGAECGTRTKYLQDILSLNDDYPRCRSWSVATPSEVGNIEIEERLRGQFDVILIPEHLTSQQCLVQFPERLRTLIRHHGIMIMSKPDEACAQLFPSDLVALNIHNNILLTLQPVRRHILEGKEIVIVLHKPSVVTLRFADCLKEYMKQLSVGMGKVATVLLENLVDCRLSRNTICISMLEIEHPFLATMESADMDRLRRITEVVSDLIWLTSADALGRSNPDLELCSGLFRALRLEQPSLRCLVMDIGLLDVLFRDVQTTCENISSCLSESDDTELVQKDGLIHISRYYPDAELNSLFTRRMSIDKTEAVKEEALVEASPVQLCIGQTGLTGSMHFVQVRNPPTQPPAGFVDVEMKAVSLNAKDVYVMHGRVETRDATTLLEFSGVVVAIGSDVDHLKPGDRVVVMAPNHFTTVERVPAWTAQRIYPFEEFGIMATLPLVYSTALYALHDRASLKRGESVLITSGAGALGMALITIAQRIGAVIYTTAGSQVKREFLIQRFGIPSSHVFPSHSSFVQDILASTKGRGVNVIVNSLMGDLMHEIWNCVARFGRFVEVGKRELVDAGRLNMRAFLKNVTFTAFDLTELYYDEDQHNRDMWARYVLVDLSSSLRSVLTP